MIIREAKKEDLLAIAKVHVDSNRTTYKGIMSEEYLAGLCYDNKADSWNKRLFGENSAEFMYVAEDDAGNIVGFASASLIRTHALYERELYAIYILEEYQRKGIGRLLVRAIGTKLWEDNVRFMILWTLHDGPASRFYEHLGGRVVDEATVSKGGAGLRINAYVWEDISCLL